MALHTKPCQKSQFSTFGFSLSLSLVATSPPNGHLTFSQSCTEQSGLEYDCDGAYAIVRVNN